MIQGSYGSQWEGYAKSAIGQAVLHLTKINEEAHMPVPGMFSQTVRLVVVVIHLFVCLFCLFVVYDDDVFSCGCVWLLSV